MDEGLKKPFENQLKDQGFDVGLTWEGLALAWTEFMNDPLEGEELLGLLRVATHFDAKLDVAAVGEKKLKVSFWFD